jgi:hypothetical protein
MNLKRSIKALGPYPSLSLLALPTATVEPLKLAAVAVAGKGHWITGTAMIMGCYAFSFLVVERLFEIVKPKLLTIPWFATLWNAFVSVRKRTLRSFGRLTGLGGAVTPWRRRADREDEPSSKPQPASK